jgi:hypothetical protein
MSRVGVGQRPVSRIVAPAFDRSGYHSRRAKRLPLGLPDNQLSTGDDEIGKLTLGFEANSPGGKRNGHPISPSSATLTDRQKL